MSLFYLLTEPVAIIMGELNGRVGKGREAQTVGNFGLGSQNKHGERCVQWCTANYHLVTHNWCHTTETKEDESNK